MSDRPNPSPENAPDSAEHTPAQPLPTEDTRAELAGLLQPLDAAAELSTNLLIARIALADLYCQRGQYSAACDVYLSAGAKDKLIALGDFLCLQPGYLNLAIDAYIDAGAKDKLIAVGDRYLQEGNLKLAAKAYTAAGANEKRIAIADRFLQGIPKEQILAYFERRGS